MPYSRTPSTLGATRSTVLALTQPEGLRQAAVEMIANFQNVG